MTQDGRMRWLPADASSIALEKAERTVEARNERDRERARAELAGEVGATEAPDRPPPGWLDDEAGA